MSGFADLASLVILTLAIWSAFNHPRWRWQAFVVVALALVWVMWRASPVNAQAPHPDHAADHFYTSWMMPDNPQTSCCSREDCAPAQAKVVDGKWFARWTDADEWTEIPPHKVERIRDMPDGRAHLCGRPSPFGLMVFCFGAGAGG